jgi:hypothetical protein
MYIFSRKNEGGKKLLFVEDKAKYRKYFIKLKKKNNTQPQRKERNSQHYL